MIPFNFQKLHIPKQLFSSVTGIVFFVSFISLINIGYAETPRSGPSVDLKHGDLKISPNQRFLIHEDGAPFFYLGDTAWELFHRLNRDEAEKYLENRRQKGFTVIQAVILAELDGLNTENAYGDKPLIENDPTKPNEAYFKHVDFIVNKAEEKGIYIGMLPTWGDKVNKAWGQGPVVFTKENARIYGKFLGNRYQNRSNIIWILGGDRDAKGYEEIWRAMAEGLKEGDRGKHLKTYHPMGGHSSSEWFHNEEWLNFNMLQSGHAASNIPNYQAISAEYHRQPTKPCLDGEPRYENHCINWKPENGWFDDFDVRQAAYWALFAGAFGHTYGCHDIWQMAAPGCKPISSARNYWYDVLDLPGAWDMMHVRNLLQSRSFFTRIPDQSLIVKGQSDGAEHIQAMRGDDYALVYIPYGTKVTIQLEKVSGNEVRAWWFDPRTGEVISIGVIPNSGTREFDPPEEPKRGNDWILVLDDASKQFIEPGKK